METEVEGETPLSSSTTTTTTTVVAGATKTTRPAAGAQQWSLGIGDLGVPQGTHVGPQHRESFCQLRAIGLQGQFGHTGPLTPGDSTKQIPTLWPEGTSEIEH